MTLKSRSLGTLRRSGVLVVSLLALPGCLSPGERAALLERIDTLERTQKRLEFDMERRDQTLTQLRAQIETLQGFDPDRPVDLFAPVRVEVADLSRGTDFDGQPGDDGVTVYLRPRDRDGNVVKVPGRITVQLLDTTEVGSPRVLGVCIFEKPEELRRRWHGRFWTDHYTLPCPFSPATERPHLSTVTVQVSFIDFLTGARLTAVKEVSVRNPDT